MDDEGIPHDDPRFVEILEACLHMEIAGHKESYKKTQGEIKRIKRNVLMKLERRKELKNKIKDAEDLISTLNVTLKKLQEHVREAEEKIALIEANVDDRSKLRSYEKQRYRDIIEEYKKTWESYHARYEEFPLAKKRMQMKINVKKARIEEMMLEIQIKDMEKKIKQKKKIDDLRMRSKIVDLAKTMNNNAKLEREFTNVSTEIDSCKQELHSMELQLKSLRVLEEEEKKARTMQLLEMPPPKINLSRVRLNYSRKCQEFQFNKNQTSEIDNDSMSVNTVTLEEMCITDDTSNKTSTKKRIIKELPDPSKQVDFERGITFTSQMGKERTHTIKNTETCIERTPSQKSTHGKRESPYTDNTEAITKERSFRERDIHRTTTSELREKEKRVVDDESGNFVYNVQELKKMKNFMRRAEKNTDDTEYELPYYSLKLANEQDTSAPRVLKIEKVQYDITPLTKQKNTSNLRKSTVSHNFETSESISHSLTLKDTLMIKELNASAASPPSLYDDSSLNFKYSECANVSTIADMDINMESVDAECLKIDQKEDEKDAKAKISHFDFSNLMKLKTNKFNLF